jgi:alpha/beta hydrolase fold
VARYVAKYGAPQSRVAKAVFIVAVPPLMAKTEKNPGGTPIEVFDGFRKALAVNRAQFFLDVPLGPFYGCNRPDAKASQGIIQNWWRQGMMGSALAHYEGIKAFSEADQTDDLKAITVPTLVMQGDDDQVVPYKDAVLLQAKLLKHATLKIYSGFPHGMMTTNVRDRQEPACPKRDFTVTSAIWLNLAECRFATLAEKRFRRSIHRRTHELEQAILQLNRSPHSTTQAPNRRKTADQILNCAAQFCTGTVETGHQK